MISPHLRSLDKRWSGDNTNKDVDHNPNIYDSNNYNSSSPKFPKNVVFIYATLNWISF